MVATFDQVCWMGTHGTANNPPNFLKVVQGGYSSVAGSEKSGSGSTQAAMTRLWWRGPDGRPHCSMVSGKESSAGQWSYNTILNKWELTGHEYVRVRKICIGDRVGFLQTSACQAGPHIYHRDIVGGAASGEAIDWVSFGNSVLATNANVNTYAWSYPFSSNPSAHSTVRITRLCVHNGKFYGLRLNDAAQPSIYIYEWVGSSWVEKANLSSTDNTNINVVAGYAASHAFFSHSGSIWIVLSYDLAGTNIARCFQVDVGGWTITERPNMIPSSDPDWTAASASNNNRIIEIPYVDSNCALQYLILQTNTPGPNAGWAMVNFDPNTSSEWTKVASGSESILPVGGAIWNEGGGSCRVVEITDHDDYLRIVHQCSHIQDLNIDVRLRYEDQGSPDPDGTDCPEYTGAGSEGTTDLSTSPSDPGSLSALNEDFSGDFDSEKLMICNTGFDHITANKGWYGPMGRLANSTRSFYPWVQQGGGIYFSALSPAPTPATYCGIGAMLRWEVSGDFAFDLTVDRLTSLVENASQYHWLYAFTLTAGNRGWGWGIRSLGASQYLGVGILFQLDTTSTSLTGSHVLLNGDIMRISRAGPVLQVYADTAGANEEITPAGMPMDYVEDVRLYFGVMPRANANPVSTTPGVGFSQMSLSGTGSVGKYFGHILHKFDMDLAGWPDANKAFNFYSAYKQDS